jgi:hypothetical protein
LLPTGAKDWADPVAQPELVYTDDDGNPYGNLAPLTQNINMGGGAQNFPDVTPDDWAAKYYQVTPQAGCPYLQMEVDGASGAQIGINFMAAKTSAPTRVLRSAKVGEDFVRTFAANGVHNRLVAAVNSFSNNYNYTSTSPVLRRRSTFWSRARSSSLWSAIRPARSPSCRAGA